MRIIRRRYSLAVLNAIHSRAQARYHDIAEALPGISSSTLAETLHALEAARLLTRQQVAADSQYNQYAVTESGMKLLSRLRQLLDELEQ